MVQKTKLNCHANFKGQPSLLTSSSSSSIHRKHASKLGSNIQASLANPPSLPPPPPPTTTTDSSSSTNPSQLSPGIQQQPCLQFQFQDQDQPINYWLPHQNQTTCLRRLQPITRLAVITICLGITILHSWH